MENQGCVCIFSDYVYFVFYWDCLLVDLWNLQRKFIHDFSQFHNDGIVICDFAFYYKIPKTLTAKISLFQELALFLMHKF
jgi:hypothetical protein